jgi:hypothetical protein
MKRGVNSTVIDTLTVLGQSMESLRPVGAQPAWAEITGPLEHPEGVRWHPDLLTMVGFFAPPECAAVAAVGHGWARGLDGEGPPGILAPGERRRCRMVCVMARSGEVSGYVRTGATILVNEAPTEGRILDCMRRCFALPTPPPQETTDAFLAYLWLSDVLGVAQKASGPLSWPAVIERHPVLRVAAGAGLTITDDRLLNILRIGADGWSWAGLAAQAATPGWMAGLLPDGAGGWMDEGILSRWLLQSYSNVEGVLARVTPRLAPPAAKKLRRTLLQLGVLPRRPPPGRPFS